MSRDLEAIINGIVSETDGIVAELEASSQFHEEALEQRIAIEMKTCEDRIDLEISKADLCVESVGS